MVASYDALTRLERRTLDGLLARVGGASPRSSTSDAITPSDYTRLQSLKARDVRVAAFLRTG